MRTHFDLILRLYIYSFKKIYFLSTYYFKTNKHKHTHICIFNLHAKPI